MCKECGYLGLYAFFYKWPKTEMIKGLNTLLTDQDVMEMCELLPLPPSRIIYVYSVVSMPISMSMPVESYDNPTQEFAPSQDEHVEYVDPSSANFEKELEDILTEQFGSVDHDRGSGGQSDGQSDGESDEDYNPDAYSDSDFSFYSDGSNMDSTDDEVCNLKSIRVEKSKEKGEGKEKGKGKEKEKSKEKGKGKEKDNGKGKEKEKGKGIEMQDDVEEDADSEDGGGSVSDVSSHYASSDEERMACNSSDEEDISFPIFNHITDMKDPKFLLSMMFASSKVFRDAVKK